MSFFGKLFNSDKKDTTYNGTKPVTSLSQVQGGPEYYNAILGRSRGQNVGYGDSYTSNANPQMEQLRNQYTGYQLPALNSELTATGRRRGSSGFQQIARSQSDEADKENAIMAQLMQRNAEASHNDVTGAVGQLGNYASNEANLVGQRANFDYADNARQVSEANARRANEAQGLQQMGQAGVSLIAAPFTGGTSMGFGQFSNPFQQQVQARQPNYSYLNSPSGYGNYSSLYGQAGRIR